MRVIGLMSGTSADGVDAALVEIREAAGRWDVRLLAFETFSFPPGLRERILVSASEGSTAEICRLNAYLGELFADAALAIADAAGIPLESIGLIGSHGQTIHHLPAPTSEGTHRIRSTLQIGEPAIIAERTGIKTVANFRPRDMAAGGEGAPLTPLVHHILFGDPERGRAILNIGGIANLTALPPGCGPEAVFGFDTGPGNVLMDEYVRVMGLADCGYDPDGRLASAGSVRAQLLAEFLAHPFIRRIPPKTTGREMFGPEMVAPFTRRLRVLGVDPLDGLATLAAFTADAVVENLRAFVFPVMDTREIMVMGGGGRNEFLMRRLREGLPDRAVVMADASGFPGRAVEAVAFAVLAYLTVGGRPGNLPAVTGASGPRVLGCIVPGREYRGFPLV
jgi:anhydro-N-acetylmuramic acid kinase